MPQSKPVVHAPAVTHTISVKNLSSPDGRIVRSSERSDRSNSAIIADLDGVDTLVGGVNEALFFANGRTGGHVLQSNRLSNRRRI